MTDSDLCINAKPPTSGETERARRDQSIGIQVTANVSGAAGVPGNGHRTRRGHLSPREALCAHWVLSPVENTAHLSRF
jgi:hypothetical protein